MGCGNMRQEVDNSLREYGEVEVCVSGIFQRVVTPLVFGSGVLLMKTC